MFYLQLAMTAMMCRGDYPARCDPKGRGLCVTGDVYRHPHSIPHIYHWYDANKLFSPAGMRL